MFEPTDATRLLELLGQATETADSEMVFRQVARLAASALNAKYAFVAESLSEHESRSLAYWEGAQFGEGFSYRFPGTPCQRVAAGLVCHTSTGLQELYPEDTWLQVIGAVSYVGIPMRDVQGLVPGHLAVLNTEPFTPTSEQMAVLKVLVSYACAALSRRQLERRVTDSDAQIERLRERLVAESSYHQEELNREYNFEELVGKCETWRQLMTDIDSIAATDVSVLIQGETGTGKELVARAIHARSARRDQPLVKVNCGAIAPNLAESELFGHAKGAFTGAVNKRLGRFELADRGTLFLDEVGELSPDTQVKLLRVLQEQEFEPVGSTKTVQVDVRIVAASNRDLAAEVDAGRFRRDLFYRLNVIPLHVAPLRDRKEDIPMLALHFAERAAKRNGKLIRGIATATLQNLTDYAWPGNVRELQNLIQRAVVFCNGPALTIDPRWLGAPTTTGSVPPSTVSEPRLTTSTPLAATNPATAKSPARVGTADSALRAGDALEDVERAHIVAVLQRANWIIEGERGAARLLDMNPSTVRSRMKRLGITRPT